MFFLLLVGVIGLMVLGVIGEVGGSYGLSLVGFGSLMFVGVNSYSGMIDIVVGMLCVIGVGVLLFISDV